MLRRNLCNICVFYLRKICAKPYLRETTLATNSTSALKNQNPVAKATSVEA